MDIAALSINLNQMQLKQQVSLAITNEVMDVQQQSSEQMLNMVEAPHPTAGHNIDSLI